VLAILALSVLMPVATVEPVEEGPSDGAKPVKPQRGVRLTPKSMRYGAPVGTRSPGTRQKKRRKAARRQGRR
jgi:hypothetical protein